MPPLNRRRSENPHHVTWHVYYGDVRVGTIGERVGVPVDVDQWEWSCGFYPGLHPGQHRYGTVPSFDEARAGFEADWNNLLPQIPEGAFEEWRHQRDFTAEKYAMWARGEKLPSQMPSSMMRRLCGERFDSHDPERSTFTASTFTREIETMKFVEPSAFTDPDVAARRLVEIASTVEAVQDGRIFIELVNQPFLDAGAAPGQFSAALARAIELGWALAS
jgi:hypothetical protein